MEKLGKIGIKCIKVISVLLFFWIVMLMLFFANNLDYACKRNFIASNIVLIVIAIVGYLIIKYISSKKNINIRINFDKFEKIALVILFILEIYISYNIFFETGWDSGFFVVPAAKDLLNGTTDVVKGSYFSWYPNNIFIVNIYYLILRINRAIGIFTGEYQLMSIVVVNCFISSLSCHLIYILCKKYLSEIYAILAFIVAGLLIGLSPWMVICYSDSLALFVPILIIYIYDSDLQYIKKGILFSVITYLGYCIKPQVVIVAIAILLVEVIKYLCKQNAFKPKKTILVIIIFLLTCGTLSTGLNYLYHQEGFEMNRNMKYGITHFFMMGLNPDSKGIWNAEDVTNSASYKTVEERNQMNIHVAISRLEDLGPIGYFQFLSNKMLTNYNDGTFAWSREGNFYYKYKDNLNTSVSGKLKSIYYADGNKFKWFEIMEQFLWVIIVMLCLAKTVFELKKEEKNYFYILLILSLIGITLFELLFEARARYIYIYVPIYIIVAITGFKDIQELKLWRGKHE